MTTRNVDMLSATCRAQLNVGHDLVCHANAMGILKLPIANHTCPAHPNRYQFCNKQIRYYAFMLDVSALHCFEWFCVFVHELKKVTTHLCVCMISYTILMMEPSC